MVERRRFPNPEEVSPNLLGPPARLATEDAVLYEELMARVRRDLKPKDIIEEIWTRDFVENTIEVRRWRRIRTKLLDVADLEGHNSSAEQPRNMQVTGPQKLLNVLGIIERLDQLISIGVARGNADLREMDRRRAIFACEKLGVEDAEFRTIKKATVTKRVP